MKILILMMNIIGQEKRYFIYFSARFAFLEVYCSQLLLLSGPPGLGKTTMAHVIAQQAGYEVMEINARFDIPNFIQHTNVLT